MHPLDKNVINAHCAMASNRIRIVREKRAEVKIQRQQALNGEILSQSKDIAKKYQNGEIEVAQIAVPLFSNSQIQTEGVINLKKTVAALEILNLYIQTFKTRVDSLNYEEKIPANMRKYIASILFCDGRIEIKELSTICAQIRRRYGSMLDELSEDVDPRIASRLTPCIPNPSDVSETLQDILRKNGVSYQAAGPDVNPIAMYIQDSVKSLNSSNPVPPCMSMPDPNAFNAPLSSSPSNLFPSVAPISSAPVDPLSQPGGFAPMSGDMAPQPGLFPSMPPSAPGGPSDGSGMNGMGGMNGMEGMGGMNGMEGMGGMNGMEGMGGMGGMNNMNGMNGMGGMGGMNLFQPMQPGVQNQPSATPDPFSMGAPNVPTMGGPSDADDYMKKLNSYK